MGRRPEADPNAGIHLCERPADRWARKSARSNHLLPGIFLQSGRNLRKTFMQAVCLCATTMARETLEQQELDMYTKTTTQSAWSVLGAAAVAFTLFAGPAAARELRRVGSRFLLSWPRSNATPVSLARARKGELRLRNFPRSLYH